MNTTLVPLVSQLFSLRDASFSTLSSFDFGKVNINPPALYMPMDPQCHGAKEEATEYTHLETGKQSSFAHEALG